MKDLDTNLTRVVQEGMTLYGPLWIEEHTTLEDVINGKSPMYWVYAYVDGREYSCSTNSLKAAIMKLSSLLLEQL
jgi:hypothetical protein